tara:strand:- start:142 stop:513 length:372 start_codon:yes stop_codon:yes gene_type:complete
MKYKWKKTEQIFNTEQDLINHLRSLGDVTFNDASDEYILNESYQNDEWEYVEVKIEQMGAIKQTVMEMVDDITILVIKDKYGDDVYKDDGFRLKDNILDEFQELFDQIETIVLEKLGILEKDN